LPVPTYFDVVIVPQQPIGFYRVDFAIPAKEMRLVVEVDGHGFHEKTKEQAAKDKRRDRDLQQEGGTSSTSLAQRCGVTYSAAAR
jgi:very-short-patch-repair endonuclease